MAYKVAITGGIGSGKSIALDIAKEYGFKVFSCDKISRTIYKNELVKEKILKNFGKEVFSADNKVLRKRLAERVFADENSLKILNEITHPEIMRILLEGMSKVKGVAVAEVPLLFEVKGEKLFDEVLVIVRPIRDRINAVALRDGLSETEVKKRIDSQIDYAKINLNAYTIIENDGNLPVYKDKLRCVFEEIKKKNI